MNKAKLYTYCPRQGVSLVLTSTTSTKLKSTFGSRKGQLDCQEPILIPKSGRKFSFARLVPLTHEEPPDISSAIAVRSSVFCAKERNLERGDPFRQADPFLENVTWTLLDVGEEIMQTGGTACFWSLPIWYSHRISQGVPRGLSEIAVPCAKGNKRQTEPSGVPRQQRSNWFYVAMILLTPVGWHLASNIEDEEQELLQ